MLSRFHLIPERHGRTDRQTDRIAISIPRVSVLTRDKNRTQYRTQQRMVVKGYQNGYLSHLFFLPFIQEQL